LVAGMTQGAKKSSSMNSSEIAQRIIQQRQQRYPNSVPGLGRLGQAPCRIDGVRLRIAFAGASTGNASAFVAGVLAYCRPQGLAPDWTVIPSRPGESELASALVAHGFHVEEGQRVMAHQGPLAVAPQPRVSVAPIETLDAMMVYEAGSRAAFFNDQFPMRAVVERRARQRIDEQERGWCRYLATYRDNRPVGGCYYTHHEDVPTIIGVYTVPAARNQGVATILLAHVVNILQGAGNDMCCLYVRHGNPAEQLYRGLGFVPLFDEYTFTQDALGSP